MAGRAFASGRRSSAERTSLYRISSRPGRGAPRLRRDDGIRGEIEGMTGLTTRMDSDTFVTIIRMDRFLTATEARQRFLKLLDEVKNGERIIITRRGRPAAAVIDFERLQLLNWVKCQTLSLLLQTPSQFPPLTLTSGRRLFWWGTESEKRYGCLI